MKKICAEDFFGVSSKKSDGSKGSNSDNEKASGISIDLPDN